MRGLRSSLVPIVLGALLASVLINVGAASKAQARRGIAIINTGEDFFRTGPLPEPYASHPDLAGFESGYMCSIVGVFWIYATWWDCKAVAFKDDTYNDDAELVAAITGKYTEADIEVGFWKGYMRWVLLAVIALLGGAAIFIKDDDDEAPKAEDEGEKEAA